MVRALGPIATLFLAGQAASANEATFPGPLAPLVGHCWSAPFPDGKSVDTHCYRLTNNGQTVEDRHVVSGNAAPYSGITFYHFDRETSRIVYTYHASDGGVSRGALELREGGFLIPQDRYVGPDGKLMTMRSEARIEGPESYAIRTFSGGGAGASVLFDQRFRRSSTAPHAGVTVAGDLALSRAIIRASDSIGAEVAAYLAIENGGPADRLLSIECDCAGAVELHTMVGEGSARRMENSWPLELPAGSRAEIKPGTARHLMLIGTKRVIRPGEPINLVLRFERAGAIRIEFQPVTDSNAAW